VGDRSVMHRVHSIYSYEVCVCVFQKQGKKLRREGKDKWIDFAGKVKTWSCFI